MKHKVLYVSILSILLLSFKGINKPSEVDFHFDHFSSLNGIPEPSDVVYDKATNHLLIVSDHGILFECDTAGKILRKAQEKGMDFEGVEVKDDYVYVSDETPRKVYKYNRKDLSLKDVYTVSFSGAMNKAFESITYNYTKHCFVMVSQQPAVICEYNDEFVLQKKYSFHSARDISNARWYQGYLYLLSGLDRSIFKCDPETYEVKEVYHINVLNPEGLAFDDKGNVIITSDDLQRIYFFKNLPPAIQKQ
jgi:uncharacterized protein YjiK